MRNISSRVSTEINAPASIVWEALTSPGIIKKYFFGTDTQSDWRVGSRIRFTGEWEGKPYEDTGTILEVNPCKTIRYTYWSSLSGIPNKPENYLAITYSLREINAVTTITVTQENIPDDKSRSMSEETWKNVLDNLKDVIQGEMVTIS